MAMDDNTLKGIVTQKLNNTLAWIGGDLQKDREKALSYYRGDPFGNEQTGRSAVISRDVAESIDAMMPSLIKIFATTDTYVVFSARRPEDEEAAKQKTDYCNWVFQSQPNAFRLLQTTLKDGLLSKLGIFKSWWEESTVEEPEEYEGLTKVQYDLLLADENVREIERAERVVQGIPSLGNPEGAPETVYDVKIARSNKTGHVCIDAIPNEEFLVERRTVSLDPGGASFASHRASRTKSDLIEQGFDKKKVMAIPGGSDDLDFNPEVINRFRDEESQPEDENDNLDPAMQKVWVAESYLKVDYDEDGIAEWRKVTLAGVEGYELLDNEEADGHPFNAWTPYLQPHKLIGESVADKTMDLQLWKSTVIREMNDGMYFNNAPQLVVVEGMANMEDVLTRRPGGVIRTTRTDAVTPLAVVDNSQAAMAAISYIDSVKETRTGVRRFTAGLNGDELNPYASTATGANLVEDSSQDTLDLIARNYAELALKPLFERIAELTSKYQDRPMTVKLRGKWVNIDPSAWKTKMDATVTVGLGSGNKDKVTAGLLAMLKEVDMPIAQFQNGLEGPLLNAGNVYNKLTKLTEAMGFKMADGFYMDPATAPPAQPQPDPKMVEVQGKLKLQEEQGKQKLMLEQQKATMQAGLEREKAQREAQQEAAQAQADMAVQQQQADLDARLAQQDAALKERLAWFQAQVDAEIARFEAKVKAEVAAEAAESKSDE